MSEADFEIPAENLPAGFAESIDEVPETPAPARPAATVALARDAEGRDGIEILLVQRNRSSGFVPGAWVFPGGRVDAEDGDDALLERTDGLTAEEARARLDLEEGADPPAVAYFFAAAREAFEETGLLVGTGVDGEPAQASADNERMDEARNALLEESISFVDALSATGCRIAGGRIEYIAHWITPLVEPRRYDTRFFLAEVPSDAEPVIDPREMIDARWLLPAEALLENEKGHLPMVFPTIKTLEQLAPFPSVSEAIAQLGRQTIPAILPELVVTPTGVGIQIPESTSEEEG